MRKEGVEEMKRGGPTEKGARCALKLMSASGKNRDRDC